MIRASFRAQTRLRGWGEEFGPGFEDQWPECCRKPEEMILVVQIGLRRLSSAFEWSAPFAPSTEIPLSKNTSHIQASAAELKDKLTFSLSTQAGYKGKGNMQNRFWGRTAADSVPGDLSVASLFCWSCFFRLHWPWVTWSKKRRLWHLL